MKTCPSCGEEIQDAALRCRFCGTDLVDPAIRELSQAWPRLSETQRTNRWRAMSPERQAQLEAALKAPLPPSPTPPAPPPVKRRTHPVTMGCAVFFGITLMAGLYGAISSDYTGGGSGGRVPPSSSSNGPPLPPPPRPAPVLDLLDTNGEIDGDWIYVRGTVRNSGTAPASYVKVRADFKNDAAETVDSSWVYAVDSSPLHPGQSRRFEIMHRFTPGAGRYSVYIEP